MTVTSQAGHNKCTCSAFVGIIYAFNVTVTPQCTCSIFVGIIYAFNVTVTPQAGKAAEEESVKIRTYNVIYKLFDNLIQSLNERLPLKAEEEVLGMSASLIISAPALKCRRAIAIPPASASTCKMLGQMLKSWNFSLSVIFLAF